MGKIIVTYFFCILSGQALACSAPPMVPDNQLFSKPLVPKEGRRVRDRRGDSVIVPLGYRWEHTGEGRILILPPGWTKGEGPDGVGILVPEGYTSKHGWDGRAVAVPLLKRTKTETDDCGRLHAWVEPEQKYHRPRPKGRGLVTQSSSSVLRNRKGQYVEVEAGFVGRLNSIGEVIIKPKPQVRAK